MDPPRGKQQHLYKSYKTSNCQHKGHFESNNYNTPSNHAYYKSSRIQKYSLKRKDHLYKGSCRSRHPYRRCDAPNKKAIKSAEDLEEEERKKKLNDTAKKLLSKIKTWNAEKSVSEESAIFKEDSQQSNDISQVISECDSRQSEENKKRIAHSRKAKLVKNRTPKRLRQPARTTTKYEVNKATVKDFQNRIQHKLIEEIMQMPRENLQNVLNDPKINPIMGLKMSRLVQENRPLITQKLRALAESKMKSLGFTSNPQLLVDIDKLIDPVIETDLSVLPYELIKQMENLFQVQFDYSQNSLEVCQEETDNVYNSTEGGMEQETAVEITHLESNDNLQNFTLKEDLSLYECSTDEDEEIMASNFSVSNPGENFYLIENPDIMNDVQEISETEKDMEMVFERKATIKEFCEDVESSIECDVEPYTSGAAIMKERVSLPKENQIKPSEESNFLSGGNVAASDKVPEEPILAVSSSSTKEFVPASCQTDSDFQVDVSTQTSRSSEELGVLYGVPLPKESKENSTSSLLEEVNTIQNLTNKLNERRLMIFLELSRMNPKGNFVCDDRAKENFAETLSNGSIYLVEALKDFFKVRSRKNYENPKFRSSNRRWKSSGKWVNKSRTKNTEDR